MATVRTLATNALIEIGVLQPGEALDADAGDFVLTKVQNMIDAWGADRLTLSLQLRTTFTLTSGTSTVTVGSGQVVNITRPMFINAITYVVPASSPAVEVPIGLLDEDSYAALSIKGLSSAYPLQAFYQTNIADANGTLFFWPTVSQNVTIALYTPQAVGTPATLDSTLIGPNGYQEAFHYQLAIRLAPSFGRPITPDLATLEARATRNMKRPNVDPGVLGIDAALVPHLGAGYNILSDQMTAGSNRG